MMLISGPSAIYAQRHDSSRYVESVISMRWRSAQCEQWRSVRIYCDGNGDEVAGYLRPLVRFANWDRRTALERRESAWTSVSVELAELPFDSPDIENRVIALQRAMDRPSIGSHGWVTRRNHPELPAIEAGFLFVYLESGHQSASRSAWVSEAEQLNRAAEELSDCLRRHSAPVNRSEWLEAYDWSPGEITSRHGWKWDGSIPETR